MATCFPAPRRHPTALYSHRIFYELAERSPLLTPYDGEDPVGRECFSSMREATEGLRKQAEACKEGAIGFLSSALDIHPDKAPLYLQRGLAYWRQGNVESMEVDMSTALALDSSPSTAAAHFLRALGRMKCGHITGALDDLLTCSNKLGRNTHAGSCARQEHNAMVPLLVRQRKYCDEAAVAAAAEACAALEARGAALAEEARAQGSLVRQQWQDRIREQRAAAAPQANAPEETTDIPTVLRINTQAKSYEDQSPVDSPRSVASWPVSSAPSSPPDSPRQADGAPAQQCLTAGDARAEAALREWEEYSAMLCQQRKAMPAAQGRACPRQAEVAPVEDTMTFADILALAAVQQWEEYSADVCRQRAEAAHAGVCNPPISTRQAPTCCRPHMADSSPHHMSPAMASLGSATCVPYITFPARAVEDAATDAAPKAAASSPSDSPRLADVAQSQPSASSAPEQPAAAPAEQESAAEAPVCLCMHEDGATEALTPLERYRCAASRHPCCSCGRYCKPSDGQQQNPDILAALATMKQEAEVYLRQLKTSQPRTETDGLQPSSHMQSALSTAPAGAKQDGCGATRAPQPQATTACNKKDKKKGKKRKGHCRRA